MHRFCLGPDGDEVEILSDDSEGQDDDGEASPGGENCHFHAGVEYACPFFFIALSITHG